MATEDFCRFCLVTGIKMETVNAEEIECFNDFTESDFPLLACYECRAMIRKMNVFLTKLITSLTIQRHMLQSESEISEEDIKHIDRESLKLISSLKCCEEPLVISCDTNPEGSFDLDTKVSKECTNNNKRNGKVKEEIVTFNENEDEDDEYLISSENDDILDDDTVSLDGILEDCSNSFSQVSNEEQRDGNRKRTRPDLRKICLEEFYHITELTLSQQIEEISKRKDSPNYKYSPYKCELCFRGFKHVRTYQNHVNLMHNPKVGRWKCQVCQRYKSSGRSLCKHRESHSRIYKCKICDYVTIPRYPQSRLGHERIKHPSASSCDICGLPFVNAVGVANHKRLAHFGYKMPDDPPDPKLYCEACKIQFVSLKAWNKHLETSAKHKPLSESTDLVCRHCGATFADAAKLNAHQKERHVSARDTNPPLRGGRGYPRLLPPAAPGESPEKRAAVVARARAASRASSYRLATVEQYPQQCAHCDEILLNRQNHWRHHISRHFGKPYKEPNFMCELCGKRFMYEVNLKSHVELNHTNQVGAFECELCKAKIKSKLALYCHMQRHLKPEHLCSVCGKALASASSLKAHFRNQHGGPRPFECSYCQKTFIRGSLLKAHVQEVHLRMVKKRFRDKTKKRINIGSMPIQKPNDSK